MRFATAVICLLPALAVSFTLEGWVPISTISTILPTETSNLAKPQPEYLPTQVPLPLQTTSPARANLNKAEEDTRQSLAVDGWVAITTITLPPPAAYPTQRQTSASPSPLPSSEPSTSPQEPSTNDENDDTHAELRPRQNVGLGGGLPAAFTVPNQVSPITTVQIGSLLVVYTQTFAPIPSQFPSAQAGSIGLGTLTGSIGVVKTAEANSDGGDSMFLGGRGKKGMFGISVLLASSMTIAFAFAVGV